MWGEERRELFPDVLPDDRSESRATGEGDRRLQFAELGPVGIRSSRRTGLRERPRQDPLGPAGGDLDLRERPGDLPRGMVRSRSYGDLDLLLSIVSLVTEQPIMRRIEACNIPIISSWRSHPVSSIVISSRRISSGRTSGTWGRPGS